MNELWACHAVGRRTAAGRVEPRAVVAKDLVTGAERIGGRPPDGVIVAFPAHQVLEVLQPLGWHGERGVVDLYAEHRALTNTVRPGGNTVDPSLTDTCEAWGLSCPALLTDADAAVSDNAIQHCRAVVDVLANLTRAMPLDWGLALRRGQYAVAVAQMQARGIPVSPEAQAACTSMLNELRRVALQEYPQCFSEGRWNGEAASRWMRGLGIRGLVTPTIDWCRSHQALHVRRAGELAAAIQKLTQASRVPVDQDCRSRADLRPYAAVTGRNQPRNYVWETAKQVIEPAAGRALAIVDYAQQEFGIAAALSGDRAMISDYGTGDAYIAFGNRATAHGVKGTYGRHKFKSAALQIMYGTSALSLARDLSIPQGDAAAIIAAFNAAYPACRQWMREARAEFAQTGTLKTAFGWHLCAPSVCSDFGKLLRTGANFPIQANGTEILWAACRRLSSASFALCGTLHDAVMLELDESESAEAACEAEVLMEEASVEVLSMRLRTNVEVVAHGRQWKSQRRMWSSIDDLVSTTVEASR